MSCEATDYFNLNFHSGVNMGSRCTRYQLPDTGATRLLILHKDPYDPVNPETDHDRTDDPV